MKNEKYAKIRKKLRCYRVTKKELEARTRHIEELRKILMNPLPATEHTLRKIYAEVIDSMEHWKECAHEAFILKNLVENDSI